MHSKEQLKKCLPIFSILYAEPDLLSFSKSHTHPYPHRIQPRINTSAWAIEVKRNVLRFMSWLLSGYIFHSWSKGSTITQFWLWPQIQSKISINLSYFYVEFENFTFLSLVCYILMIFIKSKTYKRIKWVYNYVV